MRIVLAAALVAALSGQALAQGGRQPASPRGGAPAQPAPGQGSAAAQSTANPQIFPCRTADEVCFLGIVTGPSQVSILFTNAPAADEIEPKPISVSTGEGGGTPVDLSANLGRVVMLTGTYDAKAGLTKAEVVEVASPLISALIKLQAGSEDEEDDASPASGAGAGAKGGPAATPPAGGAKGNTGGPAGGNSGKR